MIKIIKPLNGLTVPMPEYNYAPLPIEGMELNLSSYWQQRHEEGSVSVEDAAPLDKKPKKES